LRTYSPTKLSNGAQMAKFRRFFAYCIFSERPAARFRHASQIRTKASPCVEVWYTSNLRRLRLGEGDVISLVNDTVVKTVEARNMGTFEPSLATDSNLTEVELPEHVNVLFLRTTNECNLTSASVLL